MPSSLAPDPRDLGPDPLAGLSLRAVARLARRAHRRRMRGSGTLGRLADATGVSTRRLHLLADAWAEGGPSGVAALGPAPREVDTDEMGRVDAALDAWRRRHYPLEVLRWDAWRNRVTVWHLVPGADRRGDPERRALAHLRLTGDGRWHLYRKAAQGEWWPVTVDGPRVHQDLDACLAAVCIDRTNVFWATAPRRPERGEFWVDPERYSN